MKNEILANLENPKQLEQLYRSNKSAFRNEFNTIHAEVANNPIADFWNTRLNFETTDSTTISWGSQKDILFVICASLIAGFIAKIPQLFNISENYFYQRNIGFIVLPILTLYFIRKNQLGIKKILLISGCIFFSLIFINTVPESSTFLLSSIHLPIFLWAVLGFAFVGEKYKNPAKRVEFLKYNGEVIILTVLILIAGAILTGMTIGLFSLIGYRIESFYTDYIVILGLSAAPIVATYVVQSNPELINKVSSVLAKIFSPLVLITLVTYLVAIIMSGKNLYTDREFLIMFNGLLIGVMAIIVFSVTESLKASKSQISNIILFWLSVVTIILNAVALSAIIFRISEWGISPNKLAMLGVNILMLINLFLISIGLFKAVTRKSDIIVVESSMSKFLPIYAVWVIIVTFIFPIIF